MCRAYRAIVFLWLCAVLAACSALSGLDQIQVSACAPDGCDASTESDSLPPLPPSDAADGEDTDAADEPTGSDEASDMDGGLVGAAQDATEEADATSVTIDATADVEWRGDTGTDADAAMPDASPDVADGAGGVCGTLYFQDSFASNANGWTLDADWTIAEECAAPPAPQKGNPDPTSDHTGTQGSGVVGAFVCGNNPSGQTSPFRYATSPIVDVSNAPAVKLGFWRWLNTDAAGWMASTVDVYNGTAWVNIYTNPSGTGNYVTDSAWTYEETDVTAQKNSAFRVRFGYSIVNAAVYEMSAWNVDDVTLSSGSCE
jgi:hypothetical protein